VVMPKTRRYHGPPEILPGALEADKQQVLMEMYEDFVLDLYKGVHMTQITMNQDYCDIHCQLLDDLQTLMVDEGSGCRVEFPLGAVSKAHRVVKNDDKWCSAGSSTGSTPMPPLPLISAEHIVSVEFTRQRLAFVFDSIAAAQKFLICMELVIRRAKELRIESFDGVKKYPTIPAHVSHKTSTQYCLSLFQGTGDPR